MKKLVFLALFLALTTSLTSALASPINLQQVYININGGTQSTLAGFVNGLDASGLGTLTYTDTTAGTDFLDAIFNYALGTPFFNEYGTTVNGGPLAGTTWSIDDWNDNFIPFTTAGSGAQTNSNDAFDQVAAGGALLNNNLLPGQNSNFSANCSATGDAHVGGSGASCNGNVAGALGFAYTVLPGQRALVTFTVSTTAPQEFALKLVHPVDAGNPTETDLYLSGSATVVPEPGTWGLPAAAVITAATLRRRRARLQNASQPVAD